MSADASNKSFRLTSVVFLAVWVTLSLAGEMPMKPGVVVQHRENYFGLLHDKLFCDDLMNKKLNDTHFPDLKGHVSTVFWSKVNYFLSDIVLRHYDKPTVEARIEPGNITVKVLMPKLVFNGKSVLGLQNGPWELYNVSGNFSLSVIGFELILPRDVVISKEEKEKVKYITHNCTAWIKDVYLEFNDPLAEKLAGRTDYMDLKKLVGELLCESFKTSTILEINFKQEPIHGIYLDMTLLNKPISKNSYIEYHHRGEFRHKNDTKPYTFWPDPIPPQDSEKMLAVGISGWTINSGSRIIYETKMFDYNYTKDDLQNDLKHLLDTTCVSDCIGNLFPNISKLHPNKEVEVSVSQVKEHHVVIVSGEVKAKLFFNIKAFVRISEYSTQLLFSVNLDFFANVLGTVKSNRILLELVAPVNSNFTVLDSRIGHLPEENLCTLTAQVFEKNFFPFITEFEMGGIKITSAVGLSVDNYNWLLTDKVAWLMTDLKKK